MELSRRQFTFGLFSSGVVATTGFIPSLPVASQPVPTFEMISVRRIADYVYEAIEEAFKKGLNSGFEDETLNQCVSEYMRPMMEYIYSKHVIYDWRVICDASNNSDPTKLVLDVYYTPMFKPELVYIRGVGS